MPDRFPGFFGNQLFFGLPQHHGPVFFDAVIVVAVLADRDQATVDTGIPGVGGHIWQIGVGLRIGDGHGFQAAVDNIADRQQKLSEYERNIDEQLLFDLHQQVFVR